MLQLYTFDQFDARLGGEPVTARLSDRGRALLVYLMLEADRPHPRDQLAAMLWPDSDPSNALHSLRQALSGLRKAIGDRAAGPPYLLVERGSVQFNRGSEHWVDVTAFQQGIESIQGMRLSIEAVQQAVDLYRGPFLAQMDPLDSLTFDEWVSLRREMLNRQAIEALEALLGVYERRGDYPAAQRSAARIVQLAPWEEYGHIQLMRLMAVNGQWSAALEQYAACRRLLSEHLGVDPMPDTTALYNEIRRHAAAGQPFPPQTAPPPNNLPPEETPFNGRTADLETIKARLAAPHCRLLTLFGPGGIGKTRLALAAARQQVGLFADGVFFASLVGTADRDALIEALCAAVDMPHGPHGDSFDNLVGHLRSRDVLLVLDNAEHLTDHTDLFETLLREAPALTLLVTSRARLGLMQEQIHPVEGLAYPDEPPSDAAALRDYDAPRLLIRAVQRANPSFTVTPESAAPLMRICQLVEGHPLGLELAAAAAWARSLEDIAAAIAHDLDSLAAAYPDVSPRQRSLRANFEHSLRLLPYAQQVTLARLSVFSGSFSRAAAHAVADATDQVVLGLLNKSLVRLAAPGRYDLHPLLRQYAAEHLTGEEAVRDRHADHYASGLAAEAGALAGSDPRSAAGRLARDWDNIRQAWQWSTARCDAHKLASMLPGLVRYHRLRSWHREGVNLLAAALAHRDLPPDLRAALHAYSGIMLVTLRDAPAAETHFRQVLARGDRLNWSHALALLGMTRIHYRRGEHALAWEVALEGVACARQAGDQRLLADGLCVTAQLAIVNNGSRPVALSDVQEAAHIYRTLDDVRGLSHALDILGNIHAHESNHEAALAIYQEALEASRAAGDNIRLATTANNLGTIYYRLGNIEQAAAHYEESLALSQSLNDHTGMAYTLSNIGELYLKAGEPGRALTYFTQVQTAAERLGSPRMRGMALLNQGSAHALLGHAEHACRLLMAGVRSLHAGSFYVDLMTGLCYMGELLVNVGAEALAAEVLATVVGHRATEEDYRVRAASLLDDLKREADPTADLAGLIDRLDCTLVHET
ncbi:MAG: BTAD domain-containing putative transcriptional regulator [Anaerolineae bacterium]